MTLISVIFTLADFSDQRPETGSIAKPIARYCFGATGSNLTSNEPNDPKSTRAVEPTCTT